MAEAIQFLFIVVVPLVLVAGGLVSLFAIGALFDALENPGDLQARVEGLFRRPLRPPKTPGPDHYYRPHWSPQEPRKTADA
jgi:hypothetical protein